MAANSSLDLSSLDFDTLKDNLKQFLKTQSALKDYDYEGSNMNVLLDVMSYNTFLNSYYLHMIASEMYLDSAQKYDSVVSHSKELNYLPRSAHSAVANVSFNISVTGISSNFTVPKGTRFSGTNSNGSFNFVTDSSVTVTSPNSTFSVTNLQINEGIYFKDSFIVNYDIENQLFVLSNQNIDTNSITVNVIEDNGASNTSFTKVNTLFGLNYNSNVYFLQASDNYKYEVVFGDGNFGRKPKNGSTVIVEYIVTNGSAGNGIEDFTLDDDLGPVNGGIASVSLIETVTTSVGGANQESLESVKFSAPRYFATQQRAVSSDDYSSLILSNFGGEIADVAVFGGELLEPKKYGRVVLAIKPAVGELVPNNTKSKITNFMSNYIAIPNRIIIENPEYIYVKLDSTVQFEATATGKTFSEIQTNVLNSILTYSKDNLEKFGNDLRFSKLISSIDATDSSIISNQTDLRLIKRITPKLNYESSFVIETENAIYRESKPVETIDHISFHGSLYSTHFSHASLISSRFSYVHSDGIIYQDAYFEDDSFGVINVYAPVSGVYTKLDSIGTVNYGTGRINLDKIVINSYENYISLYAKTTVKDIFSSINKIIIIDPSDVSINVIEKMN